MGSFLWGPRVVNRKAGCPHRSGSPPGSRGPAEEEAGPWTSQWSSGGNAAREVLLDHPALGFWSQEPAHVLTVEISNCCFSSQLQAP